MIISGRNGRRRSVPTKEEIEGRVKKIQDSMSPDEIALVLAMGEELLGDGNSVVFDEIIKHIYHTEPVSMEQFIEDPYYLGESCVTLYPEIKKDLVALFTRPYREVVYTGSLGHGKTMSSSVAICRVLYDMSLMISPQRTFGLSVGSEIVIPLISKNLTLAREILKSAVDTKIKESPYFMTHFSPRFAADYTLFPNNIRMIVGSYGSDRITGGNVHSAILDECVTGGTLVTMEDGSEITAVELFKHADKYKHRELKCLDHNSKKVRSGWFEIKKSSLKNCVFLDIGASALVVSVFHPVLVLRGREFVYINAVDIVNGDVVAVHRDMMSGAETFKESFECKSHEQTEVIFEDKIAIGDLPEDLIPCIVKMVGSNGIRQTYSISTEHKTFIANGIVVHNCNFPPKRKSQQISAGFGQKARAEHYDIVEKVYQSLTRRIKSRFQRAGGGFPGMVVLASSAATVESFTERKMRNSKDDPEVFCRDHTAWTAKPKEQFCGDVFWVLCSASSMNSRIVEDDEVDSITDEYLEANDAYVMDIPVEYREDFESNMEEALRDIAGFSTQAISLFMQRQSAVQECVDEDRNHPFSTVEYTYGARGAWDWDSLTIPIERKLQGGFTEKSSKPRRNPEAYRWCHIDVGVSGDSCGFAIGHIERWVEVVRRDMDGNRYTDSAPYYVIDVMLRINPPPGEQIFLPDLRAMIYQFQDHGYKFIGYSSDTYQYVETHQQLKRKGIRPHIISMDTSTEPYDELKAAFYERRIEIYEYEPFDYEFKHLEYDRISGKIDHPQSGSKDLADAVAGVVAGLKQNAKRSPIEGFMGKSSMMRSEHEWVTNLIPMDKVDMDTIRDAKVNGKEDCLPILF